AALMSSSPAMTDRTIVAIRTDLGSVAEPSAEASSGGEDEADTLPSLADGIVAAAGARPSSRRRAHGRSGIPTAGIRSAGCVRRPGMSTAPTAPRDAAPARPARYRSRRVLAALAGVLAAAVGLAAAELVAGVVGTAGSPVVAVGNA